MAGSKSDFLENEILDHLFGKGLYNPPTIHVALYTAAPSDAGGGTEVTGGSYARKVTAAADWEVAAGGAMTNAEIITFVEATANWGTIVAFALFDAVSGGNLLYWGDLTENKDVDDGDTAKFAAGEIDVTED